MARSGRPLQSIASWNQRAAIMMNHFPAHWLSTIGFVMDWNATADPLVAFVSNSMRSTIKFQSRIQFSRGCTVHRPYLAHFSNEFHLILYRSIALWMFYLWSFGSDSIRLSGRPQIHVKRRADRIWRPFPELRSRSVCGRTLRPIITNSKD